MNIMTNAIIDFPTAASQQSATNLASEVQATPAQPSYHPNQLTQVLLKLEGERKTWEEGAYRTSNQALYAVLANCLAIANTDTAELAKQRNAGLEAFYKLRDYSYKKDSPPATRVVKAVFGGVDRRRLSTYSLVLREAIKQGIGHADLASWIEENGGIQEIRLSQSATFVKPSAKIEAVSKGFGRLPELAAVKSEALSRFADTDFIGECCLLIAEQAANSSFIVRGITRSGGAINAAFSAMYADQK